MGNTGLTYFPVDRVSRAPTPLASPRERVKKGDIVEVLGMIIQRYMVTGDPVINCVSITKIDKKTQAKKKE